MATKRKTSKTSRTDAIALLKADHARVRELLSALAETTSRGVKRRTQLLEQVATEVRLHATVEEEIFYPAFRNAGSGNEDEKMFFEAAEEHGLVDVVLPALESTEVVSELFSARAKVLKDLIEHHAEEEEKEMFPRARELMTTEILEDLGTQIQARKEDLVKGGLEALPK